MHVTGALQQSYMSLWESSAIDLFSSLGMRMCCPETKEMETGINRITLFVGLCNKLEYEYGHEYSVQIQSS